MAANLRPYKLKGGNYFLLEESFVNNVGTPVVSVAKAGTNLQRSGIYTLTFTTVVTGTSATCIVATADGHDPSRNPSGVMVQLDGTTLNKNIVEGLSIVLSPSGSFNSSWQATIYYGAFFDTTDSTENSILREGIVVAGSADATPQRLAIRNDGADLAASCTARLVNGVRYVHVAGAPLVMIDYTDVSQLANMSPGYLMSFLNKNTTPTPDVIDVRLDALTYDIRRVDTGEVFPGGAGVPMDGIIMVEFAAGPLTGLRFILSASTTNSDQARIYVSDGAHMWQLAPDLSGTAGTYQIATTPLQITQDGGSVPGEIAASTVAFMWVRHHTLGTDTPIGNERFARLIVSGLGI